MHLIAIDNVTDKHALVWIELEDCCHSISVERDGRVIIYGNYLKSDYRDYNHFVGVIGKFNPYIRFFKKPIPIRNLDYVYLRAIHNEPDNGAFACPGPEWLSARSKRNGHC